MFSRTVARAGRTEPRSHTSMANDTTSHAPITATGHRRPGHEYADSDPARSSASGTHRHSDVPSGRVRCSTTASANSAWSSSLNEPCA